jgi:hypothetical protein
VSNYYTEDWEQRENPVIKESSNFNKNYNMHKDFHLYGTYLASRLAGFNKNEASSIACAAQAVDDFTYGEYGSCIGMVNMATTREEPKNILQTLWTTFHFLPSEINNHIFDYEIRLRTAPRGILFDNLSTKLREIFREGTSNLNLARAGVTMHVLADTYAHEGFSGIISAKNGVINVVGTEKMSPAVFSYTPGFTTKIVDSAKIGHGSVGYFPDITWLDYSYERAGEAKIKRYNPKIFIDAFAKMIEVLSLAKSGSVRTDLDALKNGTLLRIEEEREAKIKEKGAMWFFAETRIQSEERDTVFNNLMELDYFNLQEQYTPEALNKVYSDDYLNKVLCVAKKGISSYGRSDFLVASVWHRENVMKEIWVNYPNFPNLQKILN